MPFFNKLVFIHDTYFNGLFDFLFFHTMVVNKSNVWT